MDIVQWLKNNKMMAVVAVIVIVALWYMSRE